MKVSTRSTKIKGYPTRTDKFEIKTKITPINSNNLLIEKSKVLFIKLFISILIKNRICHFVPFNFY